ncbi:MAG: hypothetical protein H7338_06415 [Candidatus Sericytochromatia bacterium]|nr:hypothetical protein [Candidatus Sericytochromatia bacterium]
MIRGMTNELTLAQLTRVVQALDANHDQKINGSEIGFPPNQLDLIAGAPAGDGVALSRVAQSLMGGTTTLSLNGNYRAARDVAQSLDANANGNIDAAEVGLSDAVKMELTGGTDKPVKTADLANGLWRGNIKIGKVRKLC